MTLKENHLSLFVKFVRNDYFHGLMVPLCHEGLLLKWYLRNVRPDRSDGKPSNSSAGIFLLPPSSFHSYIHPRDMGQKDRQVLPFQISWELPSCRSLASLLPPARSPTGSDYSSAF